MRAVLRNKFGGLVWTISLAGGWTPLPPGRGDNLDEYQRSCDATICGDLYVGDEVCDAIAQRPSD